MATTEWQPIESAPKEIVVSYGKHDYGPYILVYPVFGEPARARWWQTSIGGGGSNFLLDGGNAVQPTHWMPLPAPPNTGA